MPSPLQFVAQAVVYGAFVAALGYLSVFPEYRYMDGSQALIKLAFSHAGAHVEECRKQSAEELAKLPTNRRHVNTCKRERLPVQIELTLDGELVFSGAQPPTGLWDDGPSHVYRKFPVAAGQHTLVARMRDSRREDGGFDYETTSVVELRPGQNFVVGFRSEAGGFTFE